MFLQQVVEPTKQKELALLATLEKHAQQRSQMMINKEQETLKKKQNDQQANFLALKAQLTANAKNRLELAQFTKTEKFYSSLLVHNEATDLRLRRQKQNQYREELDVQRNRSKEIAMRGNMTRNEKLLNKDSLSAYKNCKQDYSPLVVGISSTKKFLNSKVTPIGSDHGNSSHSISSVR